MNNITKVHNLYLMSLLSNFLNIVLYLKLNQKVKYLRNLIPMSLKCKRNSKK